MDHIGNFGSSLMNLTDSFINKTSEYPVDTRSTTTVTIQAFSMAFIILFSVTGNLLILIAIYKNKRLQNKTAIFIANLAIADFTTGFVGLPFLLISSITNNWPFPHALCSAIGAIMITVCAVSIGSLGSIAHDRFCAIVYPFRYDELMSTTKITCFLAWIWIQAIAIAIAPLCGWSEYIYIENEYLCTANWGKDISYMLFLSIFYFFGPSAVMVYSYIRIFTVARKHSRQIEALNACVTKSEPRQNLKSGKSEDDKQKRVSALLAESARRQFKKDAKSAFVLMIVIVVFACCWLPHALTMYAYAFGFAGIADAVYTFTTWLAMTNSMLNPILYGALNRQYRNTFKRFLCKCLYMRKSRSDSIRSISDSTT